MGNAYITKDSPASVDDSSRRTMHDNNNTTNAGRIFVKQNTVP